MVYALQTLSDKPSMGSVTSGKNGEGHVKIAEIVFGGRETIEETPAILSLINVSTPRRYDDRMLGYLLDYGAPEQPHLDHAVSDDGGNVARRRPGHARAAERRSPRRDRLGR